MGPAGAAFASAVEVGTGSEAALGVGSATGGAAAGKDGDITAGEVGADVASGVGKGKGEGRAGDAAGGANPGERVTSSVWISEVATVKDPAEAAKPAS